jgi:hypothetical protein
MADDVIVTNFHAFKLLRFPPRPDRSWKPSHHPSLQQLYPVSNGRLETVAGRLQYGSLLLSCENLPEKAFVYSVPISTLLKDSPRVLASNPFEGGVMAVANIMQLRECDEDGKEAARPMDVLYSTVLYSSGSSLGGHICAAMYARVLRKERPGQSCAAFKGYHRHRRRSVGDTGGTDVNKVLSMSKCHSTVTPARYCGCNCNCKL